MTNKPPISLINFFIFNSTYGPREGEEHKRILYYYPNNVDIDTKIKTVGLCEAMIKFTETFTDKPCNSLHTQKTRQLFLQPEKDFWLIMTLSIPCLQKTKDGKSYPEYQHEDVQDSVYGAVLEQAYNMFKLFMGTFEFIIGRSGLSVLTMKLDYFFCRYLLTLRLPQCDILDVFKGINFLPLDKNTYLRIQCFVNLLESTFSQINYTAFLYSDQLVWSGLEQDDMRIMYRYLVTSLFPAHIEQELQGSNSSQRAGCGHHFGRYITGPPDLKDESNMGKLPRVYITSEDGSLQDCHLLVYKALSATVCMLIRGDFKLTFEYFRNLDMFLGPNLSGLASDIAEQYSKKSNISEPNHKYIYFNHMNLAQKTTVHTDSKKTTNVNIPIDVLKLVADLNRDFTSSSIEDGETIVKTTSDFWVVAKKSDQREFYVILNQRNANLTEINEEVKRLCNTHFSNIFFLD